MQPHNASNLDLTRQRLSNRGLRSSQRHPYISTHHRAHFCQTERTEKGSDRKKRRKKAGFIQRQPGNLAHPDLTPASLSSCHSPQTDIPIHHFLFLLFYLTTGPLRLKQQPLALSRYGVPDNMTPWQSWCLLYGLLTWTSLPLFRLCYIHICLCFSFIPI